MLNAIMDSLSRYGLVTITGLHNPAQAAVARHLLRKAMHGLGEHTTITTFAVGDKIIAEVV